MAKQKKETQKVLKTEPKKNPNLTEQRKCHPMRKTRLSHFWLTRKRCTKKTPETTGFWVIASDQSFGPSH